jgi:phage replication initiation protein
VSAPQRTKVDWLSGRTRAEPAGLVEQLMPMFGVEGQWLNLNARKSGWMGFEASADLRICDMVAGRVAWGGDNQRGWTHLSVTGQGCDWVPDWDVAQDRLDGLAEWEPRRVDIALDTFKRETSHEAVLASYRSGGFTTKGRPPKLQQVIGELPEQGRTIYIGARASSKFLRCYEKGRQLAESQGLAEIDGVPAADWYRVELECKAKEGPLPADIIDRRDQYLAGSYPYLQELLSDVEPEILVNTRERVPQLYLADALAHIRTQYGRTLFTALVAYHGDIGAVWAKVVGRKHNPDLVAAGALLVEHE